MGRDNLYFPLRKKVKLLVSFACGRCCSRCLQLLQQILHLPLHRLRNTNVIQKTIQMRPRWRDAALHLYSALDFQLVPRVEALGCLRIAYIHALLGARLHHELRDVVLFVEQQLRGGVGHDVVNGRAVG